MAGSLALPGTARDSFSAYPLAAVPVLAGAQALHLLAPCLRGPGAVPPVLPVLLAVPATLLPGSLPLPLAGSPGPRHAALRPRPDLALHALTLPAGPVPPSFLGLGGGGLLRLPSHQCEDAVGRLPRVRPARGCRGCRF